MKEDLVDALAFLLIGITPISISLFFKVTYLGLVSLLAIIAYTAWLSRRMSRLAFLKYVLASFVFFGIYAITQVLQISFNIDAYSLFIIFPALLGIFAGLFEGKVLREALVIMTILPLFVITTWFSYNGLEVVFLPLYACFILAYGVLLLSYILFSVILKLLR